MANRKSLWDIWFRAYLIVINTFLTYSAIVNYIGYKSNSLDLQYGQKWDTGLVHLILECIIIPLALLPVIFYTDVIPQGNLSNDNHSLGNDDESFHFVLNENGKATIVLANTDKSCSCRQRLIRLIHMEIPPTSYLLNVMAAYIYLIPKSFMDAHQIYHNALKASE